MEKIDLQAVVSGYTKVNDIIYACTIKYVRMIFDETKNEHSITCGVMLGTELKEIDYIPELYINEEACARQDTEAVRHTGSVEVARRTLYDNVIGRCNNGRTLVAEQNGSKVFVPRDKCSYELTAKPRSTDSDNVTWHVSIIGYERIYASVELYDADHDTIVIEADGSKHVRASMSSRIALTDKQKSAVKMLKEAYAKCKELGVIICKEQYFNKAYAINGNKIDCETYIDNVGDDANYVDMHELVKEEGLLGETCHVINTDSGEEGLWCTAKD